MNSTKQTTFERRWAISQSIAAEYSLPTNDVYACLESVGGDETRVRRLCRAAMALGCDTVETGMLLFGVIARQLGQKEQGPL